MHPMEAQFFYECCRCRQGRSSRVRSAYDSPLLRRKELRPPRIVGEMDILQEQDNEEEEKPKRSRPIKRCRICLERGYCQVSCPLCGGNGWVPS